HRIGRELDAPAELHRIHGDESRGRRDHGRAGEGARPAEYPRELDQPRDDRDGRRACRRIRRKRLPEDGRDAGAPRTRGTAGRYLTNGGLSGVVRFEVHDGADAAGSGGYEIEISLREVRL